MQSQVELPMEGWNSRRLPLRLLLDLLSVALNNNAAIDVIEGLPGAREDAGTQEAEIDFNQALNRVQAEIKRVAPDLENKQTSSRYASYAAIDHGRCGRSTQKSAAFPLIRRLPVARTCPRCLLRGAGWSHAPI